LIHLVVMRGLDLRIHHVRKIDAKGMDPRVKPAGDGRGERQIKSTGNRRRNHRPWVLDCPVISSGDDM